MEQRYKTKNPKEVKEVISKVTDALGFPLDKDIIRPVVILNSLGLKTRQSCQGHLRRYNTYPWIALEWDAEKTPEYYKESRKIFFKTIFKDLEEFYQDRKVPYENILSFKFLDEKQLSVTLSSITNLKIFDKNRKLKLQEQFKELSDFCEYLNKKYNLGY
jgi:hypothetical protein